VARKAPGPRQPLSQQRPKVAAGRAAAIPRAKKTLKNAPPKAPKPPKKRRVAALGERAPAIYSGLLGVYPDAHCELDFKTPFQLVVATILSAQCTDKRVNMVTPVLFERYPTVEALAAAKQEDVEEVIKSTGFFRNKAKSIIAMANAVVDRHRGEVPKSMDDLVKLPGVGRKTANVILGNAFDSNEGVVVDTHVTRLSERLGLSRDTDPIKIEQTLMTLFPRNDWTMLSHLLIWHGRRVCDAKKPRCGDCAIVALCPSARI
jgi:endonuclease III